MEKQIQNKFAQYFLLYKLEEEYPLNVLLEENDKYLEPILEQLISKELIEIDTSFYQITPKGKEVYNLLMKRYVDFVVNFDVYCAVDLNKGIFAFEKFWKIEDEEEWERYLNQEQFEDLRIAVAKYKKIDPQEIVFMSYINENRFDQMSAQKGWQFDLASGEMWNEMNQIVETSLSIKEFAYKDKNDYISGEEVLDDIIKSGAELNQALWENEAEYFKEEYQLEIDSDALNAYLKKDYVNPIWKKNII